MKDHKPGTHLMRHLLATDVQLLSNVMVKEHALNMDGAKERQGLQKMLITNTMRGQRETNALRILQIETGLTEIISVMVKEYALHGDGVRACQDDVISELSYNQLFCILKKVTIVYIIIYKE
jgi:hypothetical protein